MADLTALSSAEREVLLLLAEGHTAKSIAKRLGASEGVVNQRLRQARQKAGTGSSRELARLVSEESRRESASQAARPEVVRLRGALVLSGFAFAAGVIVALSAAAGGHWAPSTPPRVVSTFPADGAQIDPGPLTLRVTFSQAMRPGSYSFINFDPRTYPGGCAKTPLQSADLKTFSLECIFEPHRHYEIGFNSGRIRHFVSANSGEPSTPAVLRFSTR